MTGHGRKRRLQTANDGASAQHDWQFLRHWLQQPTAFSHLDELQHSLLFCHRLAGLAPKESRDRFGWEKIAEQYQRQAMMNLQATGVYKKIISACKKDGIRILPLKGLSLSFRIHRNDPGHRQLSDLDILVPPGDLRQLSAILENFGYLVKKQEMLKPEYIERKGKAEFINTNQFLPALDIHTRYISKKFLSSYSGIELADIFARCVTVTDNNIPVELLDPLDEWLYLAYHFCLHHSFVGLKWLEDLFVLSHNLPSTSWQQLQERAEQAGLLSILAANIRLLSMTYGQTYQPWSSLLPYSLGTVTEVWLNDALTAKHLATRQLHLHDKGTLQRMRSFFWEFLFIDNKTARRRALLDLLFLDQAMLTTIVGPMSRGQYWLLRPLATLASVLSLTYFSIGTLRRMLFGPPNHHMAKR